MTKPPATIYVGAMDYTIREVKHLDLLGETLNEEGDILIKRRQSPACKRATVLHEVLHAIAFTAGMGLEHDAEEALVRSWEPWLLAVLRDNPELVSFLTEA